MSHKIYRSTDAEAIIIEVEGEITRKSALAWIVEAHIVGRQLGLWRYLVDLRHARNIDSDAENYHLIKTELPRHPDVDSSARVVVVVAPGDDSHNFIEIVAQNAGQDVTIFNNFDLAMQHLRSPR